jgi:hypothetical protein
MSLFNKRKKKVSKEEEKDYIPEYDESVDEIEKIIKYVKVARYIEAPEYMEKELSKLNKTYYTLPEIYDLIKTTLIRSEIGGYIDQNMNFYTEIGANQSLFDIQTNRPFYLFNPNDNYFKYNKVMFHTHPYENDNINNCYLSREDINVALRNPQKIFVIVTKAGTYIIKNNQKRYIPQVDEQIYAKYENYMKQSNQTQMGVINDANFQKNFNIEYMFINILYYEPKYNDLFFRDLSIFMNND